MKLNFFKDRLIGYGINILIPFEDDIEKINSAIYDELGRGIFLAETKQLFLTVIEQLRQSGAEGIVLGCTEIPLLIKSSDYSAPLFDTTFIHAKAAVNFALSE